jgi:hypothetical protein
MFECNREKFLKLKGITVAPTMLELQEFYARNVWRINIEADTQAIQCYERLYYFWQYYKPNEFNWLALLLLIPIFLGATK